jgi:uncharacterized protein
MRILLDSNILLEYMLDQDKADEVEQLLNQVDAHEFFISEFTLYSIGIILFRRKLFDEFEILLNEVLIEGSAGIARLNPHDMNRVSQVAQRFKLDYDDAYQYTTAEKYDLLIVSLDADFDKTERGRKTPAQILAGIL